MKKFLLRLIGFISIFLVVYYVMIGIWGSISPYKFAPNIDYKLGKGGHLHSKNAEMSQENNKVDILFLGSSHSFRGFDPRIFAPAGLRTFNLGSSAQTPIQTELHLKTNLDKFQPKLVVLDVCPKILMLDGLESALDFVSNTDNDMESVIMVLDVNHIKAYNTLMFASFRDLFDLDDDFIEDKRYHTDYYIGDGFVQKDADFKKNETEFPPITYVANSDAQESLLDVIDILKEHQIPYVLVYTPVKQKYYNSFTNNADFNDSMNALGKYYNFNPSLTYDQDLHFYDNDHLSQKGVVHFNREFISIIKNHPALIKDN